MLLEETAFSGKLDAMAGDQIKRQEWNKTLKRISDSIGSYLVLKTVVSLLTGILSYTVLVIIGIDAPLFWAFLIFLLNYIPTVGSLIATLFPACMALLQSGELNLALMVIVAVGAIQLIVGNIIEPRVMGNSLNVSSLVVILALSFWGAIWGITGMVLSVPITVIMIILFGQFETTRKIAILLSDRGKLET
jgi:predicted PurR-regulated permease PerM